MINSSYGHSLLANKLKMLFKRHKFQINANDFNNRNAIVLKTETNRNKTLKTQDLGQDLNEHLAFYCTYRNKTSTSTLAFKTLVIVIVISLFSRMF